MDPTPHFDSDVALYEYLFDVTYAQTVRALELATALLRSAQCQRLPLSQAIKWPIDYCNDVTAYADVSTSATARSGEVLKDNGIETVKVVAVGRGEGRYLVVENVNTPPDANRMYLRHRISVGNGALLNCRLTRQP